MDGINRSANRGASKQAQGNPLPVGQNEGGGRCCQVVDQGPVGKTIPLAGSKSPPVGQNEQPLPPMSCHKNTRKARGRNRGMP